MSKLRAALSTILLTLAAVCLIPAALLELLARLVGKFPEDLY